MISWGCYNLHSCCSSTRPRKGQQPAISPRHLLDNQQQLGGSSASASATTSADLKIYGNTILTPNRNITYSRHCFADVLVLTGKIPKYGFGMVWGYMSRSRPNVYERLVIYCVSTTTYWTKYFLVCHAETKSRVQRLKTVFFRHRGCHLIYQIFTKISQISHRVGKTQLFLFSDLIDIDEARCVIVFVFKHNMMFKMASGDWNITFTLLGAILVLTGRSTGPVSLHKNRGQL